MNIKVVRPTNYDPKLNYLIDDILAFKQKLDAPTMIQLFQMKQINQDGLLSKEQRISVNVLVKHIHNEIFMER